MEYSAFVKVDSKGRTFTFWDQFVFWFSATSLPAAWTYGALMAGWQGIAGALILILVVNTLSFIPWAFLGEIAAKTGGSSMAIVRPAFGIRGSIVPSIFYLVIGYGWAAVNVFIGAIALSFIFKLWLGWPSYLDPNNLSFMVVYILLVCLVQGIAAVSGHEWLKKIQWLVTFFFFILGFYQTYVVLTHWDAVSLFNWKPVQALTTAIGPISYTITFALLVDLLIAYNWTWEFIGDFSRFAKNKKAGTWGPFMGANLAQYWWFLVGAMAVAYLAVSGSGFNPLLADPSATSVALGLGWLAALVVFFATITTNAANLYASALGLSNIFQKKQYSLKSLLIFSSILTVFLSLTPLLSQGFIGFYIFFLDFIGAVVVPLWTITLVDYFIVKKRNYSDDLFQKSSGKYWYQKGWNMAGIWALLSGTLGYWIFGFALPNFREKFTAAIPTMILVTIVYLLLAMKSRGAGSGSARKKINEK